MKPCRLEFPTVSSATDEQCRANVRYSASLNLPKVQSLPKASGALAVCGGGPSLSRALSDLGRWESDIWALNGTAAYLARQGFKPTFLTAHVGPLPYDLTGYSVRVERAYVASSCMPDMFKAFAGREVHTFDLEEEFGTDPINGGSTTACRVPMLALKRGYTEIHFFGCEGSFEARTHAFKDVRGPTDIVIEAGGRLYPTNCQMMLQSENLALLMREFPTLLVNRSGGLLQAMIDHPDTWAVVEISDEIRAMATQVAA